MERFRCRLFWIVLASLTVLVGLGFTLNLEYQSPTPANNTFVAHNWTEINISVENISTLDTFIYSWNGSNTTFRNFNCTDQNMSFINDGEGGFCIDKYEASCWNADGGWNSTSASDGWREVDTIAALANGAYAGSSPGKYPWVYIDRDDARTACENAGKYLCTSEQWLAAANIKGQVYNLDATLTDCNVVAGSPAECMDTGPNNGDACNTSYMSDCVSSEGVYDMVGNVYEWVNETVTTVSPSGDVGWHYPSASGDFESSTSSDTLKYGDDGVYFLAGTSSGRAVFRGGAWYYGAHAGPFCASLDHEPSFVYYFIGFRCCSVP